MASPPTVRITDGPAWSVSIAYEESPERRYDFGAELGSRDALLIIFAPAPELWDEQIPWAAGRRDALLASVAAEVVRQRSPGSRFEVTRSGAIIYVRGR